MRKLIVNADDFGKTSGVNAGIIQTYTDGIVTSTSLMVHGKAAKESQILSKYPKLSLGLHFEIPDKDLETKIILKLNPNHKEAEWIEEEFKLQIEKFTQLTGRKPDHPDSHKHIHSRPLVKKLFLDYSKEFSIPIRNISCKCIRTFFGWNLLMQRDLKRVSIDRLIQVLSKLKTGTYELMCHPGIVDKDLYSSRYNKERTEELRTLTNPRIKEFIVSSRIKLINWRDVSYIDA